MADALRKELLWVDKYRPTTLDRLDYHSELVKHLSVLASGNDLPHLLFYGPRGAGKRTRAFAMLRGIYGPAAEKVKVEHRAFKVGDPPKEVEVTTVSSAHHIELNPGDAGNSDRLIVQEVIKEIASSVPLDASTAKHPFKVVMLSDVDAMTRSAQQALRRTMEKYSRTCRIILIADSVTRVIEPLRSRCNAIRVPAPSDEQVIKILHSVCKRELVNLPDVFAAKIARSSDGNLRRALLRLETSHADNYPFTDEQVVTGADWEELCVEVASLMMREQSNKRLLFIRSTYYELLSHAVPAAVIIERVTMELLRTVDNEIAPTVCHLAAKYDQRMQRGQKAIVHLEAFTASFMHEYKRFISSQYSMLIED